MSPTLTSQGIVLATAMAVSGTVVLLALRLQKTLPTSHLQLLTESSPQVLRSCISSDGSSGEKSGNNSKKKKKKKKRVHFADDVVDPAGYGEDFRRQHGVIISKTSCPNSTPDFNSSSNNSTLVVASPNGKVRGMPANRVALYNGILRDRVTQRMACSY